MAQASSAESRALVEIRRLLSELGLSTQFSARGDALQGQLVLGPGAAIENHFGGPSISQATFTIRPDGVLDVDDPPALRGLSAAGCQRLDSIARLVSFIESGFEQRVARIHTLWSRLRALGVKAEVNPESILLTAKVEVDGVGTVTLEGSEQGLVAREVVRWVGDRTPVSMDDSPVALHEIADKVDLELTLGTLAEKALADRSSPKARKKASARRAAPSPASTGAGVGVGPSLDRMIAWLGQGATLRPGAGVVRTLSIDDRELQFSAEHLEGENFQARLVGASGVVWEGQFSLGSDLRLEQFARDRLAKSGAGSREVDEDEELEEELVSGLLPPSPNETWVMDVRVADDDGVQVRFRGVNIAGDEYGPARVMPKANFESNFAAATHGYRMLTRVIDAEEESVTYQRLDARREPVGAPKTCPLSLFLRNFIAEAAAY